MASETAFEPRLRLHRLSWLFALTASLRQMIIPLVAIMFFGAREESVIGVRYLFPLLIAALFIRAAWRQWIFRYGFGPRGLVIHDGLIFRNVRQIEYPRIENIDTQRGLLHRLLGVAEVRVQTSTGGRPEALISVLDLDAVRRMRERVFTNAARPVAEPEVDSGGLLQRLTAAELVRYGLIDNRGMIPVAAAVGVLYETGVFNVDREAVSAWLHAVSLAGVAALAPVIQIALGLGVLVSALLAVRLLSVMLAVVTLFDFTLSRSGQDLRARYGLLTRIALTLRTPRIQAVHQRQTVLHRAFDRVSLNVDLTGDAGGGEDAQQRATTRTRWLTPLCRVDEAPALIAFALPAIDFSAEPVWRTLAPGARGRIFRRTFVLWALIALALAVLSHAGLAALALGAGGIIAFLHSYLYVKHTAWALTHDLLLFRRGWLTRRVTFAPRMRVQSVSMNVSPFDRRSRMASVVVDTAGAEAAIRIRYLDQAAARALTRDLYWQWNSPPAAGAGEHAPAG